MKRDRQNKRQEEPSKSPGGTRRDFIKKPLALAAGSIVMPSLLGGLVGEAKADRNGNDVTIAPRYYPLNHFNPQISLMGKLAVITGASRGNGRAVGEALTALGVDVIGTSRDPGGVPNPPAYPLLTSRLQIARDRFAPSQSPARPGAREGLSRSGLICGVLICADCSAPACPDARERSV
jgi:hypothetical protein